MSKNYSKPPLSWPEVDIISNIINNSAHKLLMISTKQLEIKFGREKKHKENNFYFNYAKSV